MALVNSPEDTTRLALPETLPGIGPGEWVDVASVYTAGMRRRVFRKALTLTGLTLNDPDKASVDVDVFAMRQAICEEIIRAWSDATPVTPLAIEQLQPDVQDWIATEFDRLTAGRSDKEKKDSANGSSPAQLSESAASPTSSPTSAKSRGSRNAA